jgi:hypothetical protein
MLPSTFVTGTCDPAPQVILSPANFEVVVGRLTRLTITVWVDTVVSGGLGSGSDVGNGGVIDGNSTAAFAVLQSLAGEVPGFVQSTERISETALTVVWTGVFLGSPDSAFDLSASVSFPASDCMAAASQTCTAVAFSDTPAVTFQAVVESDLAVFEDEVMVQFFEDVAALIGANLTFSLSIDNFVLYTKESGSVLLSVGVVQVQELEDCVQQTAMKDVLEGTSGPAFMLATGFQVAIQDVMVTDSCTTTSTAATGGTTTAVGGTITAISTTTTTGRLDRICSTFLNHQLREDPPFCVESTQGCTEETEVPFLLIADLCLVKCCGQNTTTAGPVVITTAASGGWPGSGSGSGSAVDRMDATTSVPATTLDNGSSGNGSTGRPGDLSTPATNTAISTPVDDVINAVVNNSKHAKAQLLWLLLLLLLLLGLMFWKKDRIKDALFPPEESCETTELDVFAGSNSMLVNNKRQSDPSLLRETTLGSNDNGEFATLVDGLVNTPEQPKKELNVSSVSLNASTAAHIHVPPPATRHLASNMTCPSPFNKSPRSPVDSRRSSGVLQNVGGVTSRNTLANATAAPQSTSHSPVIIHASDFVPTLQKIVDVDGVQVGLRPSNALQDEQKSPAAQRTTVFHQAQRVNSPDGSGRVYVQRPSLVGDEQNTDGPPHSYRKTVFSDDFTAAMRTAGYSARCAFFDRNLHSRMPLVSMPARLKRACV